MLDFSEEIKKAWFFSNYDINHSWNKTLRPKSHFKQQARLCPQGSNWEEILQEFPPKIVKALAPNQKQYTFCLYPLETYCLHYLCVVVLSQKLPFTWFARYGKKTLSTKSPHSLLLGRPTYNQKKLQHWKAELEKDHLQCLRTDIKNFFGTINIELLCNLIRKKLQVQGPLSKKEEKILEFLPKMLNIPHTNKNQPQGLAIGNSPERFFSNIYLDPLDQILLENPTVSFIRFIDDIRLYAEEKYLDKLVLCLFQLKDKAQELGLKLHPLKTGLVVKGAKLD